MPSNRTSEELGAIMRKVLLTPLALFDQQTLLICIAIRDPETQEIVDQTFTPNELANKAALPLATAQALFDQALYAAYK